jgi:hypothetical protein
MATEVGFQPIAPTQNLPPDLWLQTPTKTLPDPTVGVSLSSKQAQDTINFRGPKP